MPPLDEVRVERCRRPSAGRHRARRVGRSPSGSRSGRCGSRRPTGSTADRSQSSSGCPATRRGACPGSAVMSGEELMALAPAGRSAPGLDQFGHRCVVLIRYTALLTADARARPCRTCVPVGVSAPGHASRRRRGRRRRRRGPACVGSAAMRTCELTAVEHVAGLAGERPVAAVSANARGSAPALRCCLPAAAYRACPFATGSRSNRRVRPRNVAIPAR